jgi:hypothetical protein
MAKKTRRVSASTLSQLGYCEQLAVFTAKYGQRDTTDQRQAKEAGIAAHASFESDGKTILAQGGHVRPTEPLADRRCFIASSVYGPDAVETNTLRRFRDTYILPRAGGPTFVSIYYRYSPRVVDYLTKRPDAAVLLRACLTPLVRLAAALDAKEAR